MTLRQWRNAALNGPSWISLQLMMQPMPARARAIFLVKLAQALGVQLPAVMRVTGAR
jgi:hypothetical protein